tara:strand:+ start:349 stop:702 length:354 start_codon:yes stop_codon:yes gene_type:complete
MENRIQQKDNEVCPSIHLTECKIGEPLQDNYTGAGAALIACSGNDIIDLEYLSGDPYSNLNFLMKAWRDKRQVFVGMCSCVSFCDPQEIIFSKKFKFPDLIDQIDTACAKRQFTIYV